MSKLPMFKVRIGGAPVMVNWKLSANARAMMTESAGRNWFNQERMAIEYARVMLHAKHGAFIPRVKNEQPTVEYDFVQGVGRAWHGQRRPRFVVWRTKTRTESAWDRKRRRFTYTEIPGEELFRFEIPHWDHVPDCIETTAAALPLAA